MASIKRTVSDSNGNYLYTVLQTHCSHASAAGWFVANNIDALVDSKASNKRSTTVRAGDTYLFEEV